MILFAVQDAGPAKYLSYIIHKIKYNYYVIASSVSCKIFDIFSIKYFFDIDQASLRKVNLIITGTCLDQGIDKYWTLYAKDHNIICVSIIEHWSLYNRRFVLEDRLIYPDYIFVNDEIAKKEALEDGVLFDRIIEVGNPVLENIKPSHLDFRNAKFWKKSNGITSENIVLFISEELKIDFPKHSQLYQGFDEYQVVDDILESLDKDQRLFIKLHPCEKMNKYDYLKSKNVIIHQKIDLATMIFISNFILGMGSFLLIELALAGKKVYSYRPNQKKGFIGNTIGITTLVDTKVMLHKIEGNLASMVT